jgi:hypothetical protein
MGLHLWNLASSPMLSSDPRAQRDRRTTVRSSHDQVPRSARDFRAARNVRDCPADVCPEVKANEALAQGKADRLAIHPVIRDCSDQVWPNFDRSCLREAGSGIGVREARLMTARR